MSKTIARRTFLAATAVSAVACGGGERAPAPAAAPVQGAGGAAPSVTPGAGAADGGAGGFTEATFAEAEKVMSVTYTPADRAMLVKDAPSLAKMVRARRARPFPNAFPPASPFDPRLRGATAATLAPSPRPALRFSSTDAGPVPKDDVDLAYAPVTALSQWMRTRKLTSERLTTVYLDRLKRIGPKLECVVTLTEELALAQAKAADAEIAKGKYRGPLHGIPWGAKDLLDTAKIPTTWGAAPYKDRVPETDAVVTKRLADAGAVLVAKLSLGELANGDIWFGGKTRNPWNLDEGSSGSSAGPGAATAAGLVGFSIGSETLGSIVSPSSRCGVTGLRPTFGRVPRTGAMALCWSLDKLGPMARTVEDTMLVLAAIQGLDEGDVCTVQAPLAFDAGAKVAGKKAGYVQAWFEHPDATDVDRKALEAARAIGLELVPLTLPDLPYDALEIILFAETAAAFEEMLLTHGESALRVQNLDAWPHQLRKARFYSAVDLVQAERLRRAVMIEMDRLFAKVDVMIGPSLVGPMLTITNMTGHPCLTLRAGFVEQEGRGFDLEPNPPKEGPAAKLPKRTVPQGISLWSRLYDEGTLCQVGMALEAKLDVGKRRPPV